jgi:bifunctional oligoribonuclease and PAP phosphatase NrnA
MKTTTKTNSAKLFEIIKESQSVLITSHEEPDGDSIGSQLALFQLITDLGKNGLILNRGTIPFKYRFLPDITLINDITKYASGRNFDLAIVLDCPGLARTGGAEKFVTPETVIINIDHHPDNQNFGTVNHVESEISSVGEMLAELFFEADIPIDQKTATWLYAAILTDTGRFRYQSTRRRTMEIAGRLIDAGANPRDICDNIYYSLPCSTLRLTGAVLSGISFFENGKVCLLQLEQSTLEKIGADLSEADGLTDFALFGQGVIVGGLLKGISGNRTKVSLRSRDALDVSRLAHKFGGGGHQNAAGFIIELPLEAARKVLLEELKEIVNGSI